MAGYKNGRNFFGNGDLKDIYSLVSGVFNARDGILRVSLFPACFGEVGSSMHIAPHLCP